MLKLWFILGVGAGVVLAASPGARRQTSEAARDLSDRLVMFLLRSTSGFAEEVPERISTEERERRLRWR